MSSEIINTDDKSHKKSIDAGRISVTFINKKKKLIEKIKKIKNEEIKKMKEV